MPVSNADKPGKGALLTYDMMATIDAQWLQRNAPLLLDSAAAEAGLEFHRGKEFLAILDEFEKPDMDSREVFRGREGCICTHYTSFQAPDHPYLTLKKPGS